MSEFETRFMVSLSGREIETIISYLDTSDGRKSSEVVQIIVHLHRRLSARKKELKDLEELKAQPDYQVGI